MQSAETIEALPVVEQPVGPLLQSFHASALLQTLVDAAPADYFTFEWIIGHLPNRSFGIVILFMALLTLLPVISIPARLVIIFLAGQIILGHQTPLLPGRIMRRRLSSRVLGRLQRFAIPLLLQLEKLVRPRWCGLLRLARPLNGALVIILAFTSLIVPIPLINMPVGVIVIMMALAYIENDGVLLAIAQGAAFAYLLILGYFCVALWQLS